MALIKQQPSRMSILDYIAASDRQLVIPVYQRNYNWKAEEQVKRMLDDMLKIIHGISESHFMGIFFSVSTQIMSRFYEISLVDGQQRLTTLFLLLWALKYEYFADSSVEFIDGYLYNSKLVQQKCGEKYSLKLKPLVSDNDVYEKIAKGFTKNEFSSLEKESSVFKNYEYIVKYLKGHKEITIDNVLDALEKMEIVDIPLHDSDDPQQIFESINALGLELSHIDLIRNLVLMKLDSDEQTKMYNDYWKSMEDVFVGKNKDRLGDVFRFFVAIKKYQLIKNDELYYAFSQIWREAITCIDDRKNFLIELKKYVVEYKELYFDSHYYPFDDTRFKQILNDFRKIGSTTIAPYILEIYHLYKQNRISNNSLCDIIHLMNTYIIRRECAGYPMNDASRFFPQLLKNVKLEANQNYDKIYYITLKYLVNMNRNNSLGLPTDERVKNYLLTNNAYILSHALMILNRLENLNNATPIVDISELSVEHIMPQTQDDPGYWKSIVGTEIDNYEIHCNKIGNLTIVSTKDNSAMKNYSFEKKKEYLKQSKHIKLNEYILEKNKWDIAEIDARTQIIINGINREFKYCAAPMDKKLSYAVYLNKVKKGKVVNCNAKVLNDGTVQVLDDCIVSYKLTSSYIENNLNIRNALSDGKLIPNEDKTLTLKMDSMFESVELITEILLGDVPKDLDSIWTVEEGISIGNVISLFQK